MQLSNNFSLRSMTSSATAERLGINNTPSCPDIVRMKRLVDNVLQPVRNEMGLTLVRSGFRCLELNRMLRSSDKSQHTKGEAADIEVPGLSNLELAEWIRDNLEYDQLILEFWYPKGHDMNTNNDPNMGWVHVSYKKEGNRNQVLTINKDGTKLGLG